MASTPNDKQWFTYTGAGASGASYSMLVASWWGSQAGSGFTTFASHPVFVRSARSQPRSIIAADQAGTHRKIKLPIGADGATNYAVGATFTWLPRGSATAVTMTVTKLIGEKLPSAVTVDHKAAYP